MYAETEAATPTVCDSIQRLNCIHTVYIPFFSLLFKCQKISKNRVRYFYFFWIRLVFLLAVSYRLIGGWNLSFKMIGGWNLSFKMIGGWNLSLKMIGGWNLSLKMIDGWNLSFEMIGGWNLSDWKLSVHLFKEYLQI